MIDYLIVCLKDYKTEMDYKNVNFNSDVVALYSRLRKRIPAQRSDKDVDTTRVENGWPGLAKLLANPGPCERDKKITACSAPTRVENQPGFV